MGNCLHKGPHLYLKIPRLIEDCISEKLDHIDHLTMKSILYLWHIKQTKVCLQGKQI